MNQALIIIDIQNDYFEGGAMPLNNPMTVASKAKELLTFYRESQKPIIHIQHLAARPELKFMLEGTHGQKIHSSVEPKHGERIITKNYPNSFAGTELSEVLDELSITHVVLAGMMTHMCISSTARSALEYGLNTTIAHDACATCDLSIFEQIIPAKEVHLTALAEVSSIANIVSSEDIISRLQ
ncbi:isochorismatase [Vibrio toranzoniae]|uniref:Isochorismatase n=1 Tax=Vibrio toranzoniae TaxID=1194427 RepID=A0A109D5B5_9VIBR|nr:cysteine hydrolase family protein [Vibrio toranzoniae]KWT99001.1 isochorismatase [Vibrio toranzoniae]SBS39788.1 Streptothricin hydrolase [Vibrio toranzoniae]